MLLLNHWTGAEPHCHSHRRALACKRCIWIRQSCCLLINTLNGFSYADTCKKSSSCAVVLQDLGISKEPKFNSCPIGCAISDPAQVLSFYYFIQLHHTISSMPASHVDTTIALSWLQVGCFNTGWFVVAMVKWLESFEKIIIQQVIIYCRLRLVIQCRFANSFNCCGGLHECHLRFLGFWLGWWRCGGWWENV